jgi:hypothetical protein
MELARYDGMVSGPFHHHKEALFMKRVSGFALVMLMALPVAALGAEATGKIATIDRTDGAFVLEDGTRLWIDEGRLADLRPGEKVLATYSTKDGKKIVTEMEYRTGGDGGETTNLGSPTSFFNHQDVQASE